MNEHYPEMLPTHVRTAIGFGDSGRTISPSSPKKVAAPCMMTKAWSSRGWVCSMFSPPSAYTLTTTVIWSVDGRSGKITELGTIGAFRLARLKPGHVRLVMVDGTILHVPRGGRQTTRLAPAAEAGDIIGLDSTEDHVAMLVRGRTEVRLSLHETR